MLLVYYPTPVHRLPVVRTSALGPAGDRRGDHRGALAPRPAGACPTYDVTRVVSVVNDSVVRHG